MEQSCSWEANRFSASQETPRILWNPNVRYRIHKCPPSILSWTKSIQSIPPHPTSWRSILILSTHLCLGLASGSFPQVSPPKACIAYIQKNMNMLFLSSISSPSICLYQTLQLSANQNLLSKQRIILNILHNTLQGQWTHYKNLIPFRTKW
jgi:hypothetical protein